MQQALFENLFTVHKIPFNKRHLTGKIISLPQIITLSSLSEVLDHYRVASIAVKLQPQQLAQATFPCIAHCQSEGSSSYFVVVEGLVNGKVSYFDGKQLAQVSVAAFAKIWSGSLLLLAANAQSGEPNYAENRKNERRAQMEQWLV